MNKIKEKDLMDAEKFANYIIENNSLIYTTAKHFGVSPTFVSQRLKLLSTSNTLLYNKVLKICPRLGQKKTKKAGIHKVKETKEKELQKIIICSQSTGYSIIDNTTKKKRYKYNSVSHRNRGGINSYTVSVKYFFKDAEQDFNVKANTESEAIADVQRMIAHYKLSYLNKSTCRIK